MKILLDDLKIENPCKYCQDKQPPDCGCERLDYYNGQQSILSQLKEVDIDKALSDFFTNRSNIPLFKKIEFMETFSEYIKSKLEGK